MPKRTLLLGLIALVAAIVGGTVAYLMLSVPRDLNADRLLRQARDAMKEKRTEAARDKLRSVIATYPRTDAGAAATAALLQLEAEEQQKLRAQIQSVEKKQSASEAQLRTLNQRLAELSKRPQPAPAPPQVAAPKPAPKKVAVKKAPAKKKKTTAKKRTPTRRRR